MVFNVRFIFSYFYSTLCILNLYMMNARKGVFYTWKLFIYNHVINYANLHVFLMLKHDIKNNLC